MWQFVMNLARSAVGRRAATAAAGEGPARGYSPPRPPRSRGLFRPDLPGGHEDKEVGRRPGVVGRTIHKFAEFGNASWGIDSVASRFNSISPSFTEGLVIKVWGRRWARLDQLYILAMCILADQIDGKGFFGNQGIRALVHRTGKYVEVEFMQSRKGSTEAAGSAVVRGEPATMFHNPDWLSNELVVPDRAWVGAHAPDVMTGIATPRSTAGGMLELNVPLDVLLAGGWWTFNRVANEAPEGVPDPRPGEVANPKLVTHARSTNPHPLYDGVGRETDLCMMIAQALHDPCSLPPDPETDRTFDFDAYTMAPDPGGCVPREDVTDGPAHFPWIAWWEGFKAKVRYVLGWKFGLVRRDPEHPDQPLVRPPRPPGPTPCEGG